MRIDYDDSGPFIITRNEKDAVAATLHFVQHRGYEFYDPAEVEPEIIDQHTVRVYLLDRREEFAE